MGGGGHEVEALHLWGGVTPRPDFRKDLKRARWLPPFNDKVVKEAGGVGFFSIPLCDTLWDSECERWVWKVWASNANLQHASPKVQICSWRYATCPEFCSAQASKTSAHE